MAMTLTEANKYTTDMLKKGVIEEMVRSNSLLEILPFLEVEGQAYVYNRETGAPNLGWRDINNALVEGSSTVTSVTETLKILGGDLDIDKFILKTKQDKNGTKAIQIQLKAKHIAQEYAIKFFGDQASDATNFEGLLHANKAGANEVDAVTALSTDHVDQLIDLVTAGPVSALFMTRATRRKLKALMVAQGFVMEIGVDAFGRNVSMYDGIPIRIVEDAVLPTGGAGVLDSIVAVYLSVADGVCGIENGGLTVRDLGEIDEKPVERVRFEWYCGIAMHDSKSAGRIKNI